MSNRNRRPRTFNLPPAGQTNLHVPTRDALRPPNCTCRERVVLPDAGGAVDVFHQPGCPATTPPAQEPTP